MFIAALFTMAKIWKPLKHPWTDKWKKKIRCIHTHTHNGILLSHKKNEVMPFAATWMGLEIIIRSEGSQVEKDK